MTTLLLYPTPVYVGEVDNFDDVQEEIKTAIDNTDFEYKTDWGNTHRLSDITFTGNVIDQFNMQTLMSEIHTHVGNYLEDCEVSKSPHYYDNIPYNVATSWISKYVDGSYAHIHSHGNADISGVYYYSTVPDNAKFFCTSPVDHFECSTLFSHKGFTQHFDPKPGEIILFPGWLKHGVQTYSGDEDRYSVSFNIYFVKKENISYGNPEITEDTP
tara:strand:- start:400 stop:1041 length:642 start_codon:yes stop_codon:yes gene_type:complete